MSPEESVWVETVLTGLRTGWKPAERGAASGFVALDALVARFEELERENERLRRTCELERRIRELEAALQ